jgi:glycine dehydrogenase
MANKIEDLLNNDAFTNRHIGSSSEQKNQMLNYLGFDNLDKLIDEIVPDVIRRKEPMNIADGMSELAALKQLRNLARMNIRYKSFIGQGYYNSITPPVIQRNVEENPAWYTAYTPYQPEISQGRLEALMNFQTMVSDLTGMDLANASMLDEATACAEAMTLCHRVSKSKSNTFFVANDCYAQNLEVIKTRAEPLNIEVVVGDPLIDLKDLDCFGVLLQYPNTYGAFSDYSKLIEAIHEKKALVSVSADLLALTLLKPPGEMGADIVVGNTQRFGVPIGYGGPHAAYMSISDKYKRSMPGRIIGASVDTKGRLAYRLALQTREQHIRREKATSNICTAQALLAIMASMYAVYHGPEGLKNIAGRIFQYASVFADGMKQMGFKLLNDSYFDTLTIRLKTQMLLLCKLKKMDTTLMCLVKHLFQYLLMNLAHPKILSIYGGSSILSQILVHSRCLKKINQKFKRAYKEILNF